MLKEYLLAMLRNKYTVALLLAVVISIALCVVSGITDEEYGRQASYISVVTSLRIGFGTLIMIFSVTCIFRDGIIERNARGVEMFAIAFLAGATLVVPGIGPALGLAAVVAVGVLSRCFGYPAKDPSRQDDYEAGK